ncbi:hypothetical protein DY000_02021611 [Brassica cretica]|uniref:Uncharacterized protein n=1 Tax=Brassica cretica TaxID=69181 RepID=A0ABQ7EF77_BRACR|nr:hypothetical protein DY000_02021611 [Brassica cretica]
MQVKKHKALDRKDQSSKRVANMMKGRATRDAMKAAKRCENREGKRDETKSENYGAALEL